MYKLLWEILARLFSFKACILFKTFCVACWYLFKLNYNLHVLSIKYRCTDNCVCHLNLATSSSSTPTQSDELPKLQCRNRTNRGQKGASNKGNKGKAPAKKIRTEVSRENKFSYYKRWPLYNRYLVISELIQTQEKLWQLWFDDIPMKICAGGQITYAFVLAGFILWIWG